MSTSVNVKMACKRKINFDEFDVSDVKESRNAIVHGVVTDLKPLKKSKKDEMVKYFSGELCDGKNSIRLISFQPSLRSSLINSLEKKDAVSLVNCQVRGTQGGGPEVLLTNATKVEPSPKKFDTKISRKQPVHMDDLPSITVDQTVTVIVKVKTVGQLEEVKNRDGKVLRKQDCVVGDSKGCGRVVLWEEDVGKLKEGQCYRLSSVMVRSYRGIEYLSIGRDGEIRSIDDIGEVAEVDLEEQGIVRKVVEGEIDGLTYCEDYEACIGCNAKVICQDEVAAECTKCGMYMKRRKCKKMLTARVLVTGTDGTVHTLTMFNDSITNITAEEEMNVKRALLTSGSLKFIVDKGDIVYSVEKLN